MDQDTELLVIQADKDEISELKEMIAPHVAGERLQTKHLQAQAGDPNTWMLVAEVLKVTLPALIPVIVARFGGRKIKKIKVGDVEAEDVTAAEFEKLLAKKGAAKR
jgi:hypothetical protein